MRFRHLFIIVIIATLGLTLAARATVPDAFLSVDFQSATGTTETGFQAFNADGTAPFTVTYPSQGVTVTLTGYSNPANIGNGFPPDSGAFTYGQLYQDFVFLFNNAGPMNISLSGPAIVAGRNYQITWYSYNYNLDVSDTVVYQAAVGSNTTGSTGSIAIVPGGATPANNTDNSFTGIWRTTGSTLDIDVTQLNAANRGALLSTGLRSWRCRSRPRWLSSHSAVCSSVVEQSVRR